MQRRAHVVVAVAWAAVAGCAQVWGIGDVPVPIDATTSDGAPDTQAPDGAGADTLVPDASDADALATDSTLADTSPRDTSVDTAAADAPLADTALRDASPEAAVDAGCPTDPCVMATQLNHPTQITSDGNSVYWTEFGTALGSQDGTVKSCPVSGCGAAGPTVIATGLVNPRGIAVDGTSVYFSTATYGMVQGGIWSCPLAGCNGAFPTMLGTAGIPYGVAIDSSYVYWVDADFNTVSRVAKADAAPVDVLYDAATHALVGAQYCAVDGTGVYVTDVQQRIVRVPIAGGEPIVIFRGTASTDCPLAIDPANVYYAIGPQIDRASKSSTDGGPAIATGFRHLLRLALDGNAGEIYWADFGTGMADDGTVGKVGTDGGAVILGAQLAAPVAVTVSGNHAFWISNGANVNGGSTDPDSGTLTRVVK